MVFNALSFMVIVFCYMAMYVSIRGSHSWNSKDTLVAKRMALLVFTDFFCWAPIIFFSITAAFESNFAKISLDEAKVLTIFVLPLNSCANPFLYAFFTRQFKKDCVKLCKRIEELSTLGNLPSSGSRRASNSSNRQSQNITFNVEKRGSSSRSIGADSSSADVFNNVSDSDITVKKVHFTSRAEPSMQYVTSDSGIYLTETKSVQLSDTSPTSDTENKLLSHKTSFSYSNDDLESGPDIVLHTDEGHIYLNTSSKSSGKQKKRKMSILKEECIDIPPSDKLRGSKNGRGCHLELKAQSHKLPEKVIYKDTKLNKSSPDEIVDIGNTIKETKPTKQEVTDNIKDPKRVRKDSLEVDVCRRKHKQAKPERGKAVRRRDRDVSVATQTEEDGDSKRKIQNPRLPGAIDKQDRHKQINEWRKTSHLSFLWRKSDTFDTIVPEQKSNSLVELTRPVHDWKAVECKRHSLTSRHEGYILLKNGSRDSAYEDEDLYEFQDGRAIYLPHAKIKKGRDAKVYCSVSESYKRKTADFPSKHSVTRNEMCEALSLLGDSEQTDGMRIVKRKSCDDESGISSNS